MKSYQSSPSAQGSRRGSKRRSDGNSGRFAAERRGSGAGKPAPTFWQKVISLFKPSTKAPPKATSENSPSRSGVEPASNRGRGPAGAGRTPRKPEAIEVTSPRLYVGNLSFDATENDLSELFNGVGQVVTVEVVTHKQTQRSKGFAFVQMQSTEEAKRAVQELHDKEFMSRKLVVSGAKNGDQHDGRSEPRFAA